MKKIAFITPGDAEFGFKLAGASQYYGDVESLLTIVKNLIIDPDTGIVVVDERLINIGNEGKLRELERSWHGILLVLPSPERPSVEIEDYASRLIRRAIGYHVRLKI